MNPAPQVMLRVGVRPCGLDEGHRMPRVPRLEHERIPHRAAVRPLRRMGLAIGGPRLPAHGEVRARPCAQAAVAGRVGKQRRRKRHALLRRLLIGADAFDAALPHRHAVRTGVEKQRQILAERRLFPQDRIEHRIAVRRVAALVLEQNLLDDARLPRVGPAHVVVCTADVHADLAAGVAPGHRTGVNQRRPRAMPRGGDRRTQARHAAAHDDKVKGKPLHVRVLPPSARPMPVPPSPLRPPPARAAQRTGA